ncbi:unnamed protein product [Prorocentrum cordatum]|uniref:SAC3/GANP/THP3 conserved domain-containing protein n=1 Tax=Prorocentrum cordatum TaxID=2364126 RepID=A0ABN9RY39_9DINO|nr:unnamed protein product [Polarella glacialis]
MAYRVDHKGWKLAALEAIATVNKRITVNIRGGHGEQALGFRWDKAGASGTARVAEVFSPVLRAASVRPGALLLLVDGLDTAVLTTEQVETLLQTSGRHSLRLGLRVVLRPGKARAAPAPPKKRRLDPDMGVVTTESGLWAYNTSWAGIAVTDEEARRREARAQKYGAHGVAATGTNRSQTESGTAAVPKTLLWKNEPKEELEEESRVEKQGEADEEWEAVAIDGYEDEWGEDDEVIDLHAPGSLGAIVGTCQELEKGYLRLTEEPCPERVRPLQVLRSAVDRLRRLRDGPGEARSWQYLGDQLRSVRQDLLVQGLQDPARSPAGAALAAEVCVLNARWALAAGDVVHFVPSVSELRGLHHALRGAGLAVARDVEVEFLGCRLLCATLLELQGEQLEAEAEASRSMPFSPLLAWVRAVSCAYRAGRHVRYFALCEQAPECAGVETAVLLLRAFHDRVRLKALQRLCRAVPGGFSIGTVSRQLRLGCEEECAAWCHRVGGAVLEASPRGGSTVHVNARDTAEALRGHRLLASRHGVPRAPQEESALAAVPQVTVVSSPKAAPPPPSGNAAAAMGARARALARKAAREQREAGAA